MSRTARGVTEHLKSKGDGQLLQIAILVFLIFSLFIVAVIALIFLTVPIPLAPALIIVPVHALVVVAAFIFNYY